MTVPTYGSTNINNALMRFFCDVDGFLNVVCFNPLQAIGYKREAMVLKSEVEETQDKLKSSERIRKSMEENHRKRLSDTQEWLRSELWMKERHCQELEEVKRSRSKSI